MKSKAELANLILENPSLPLVFFCPGELEYSYTLCEKFYAKVSDIYIIDNQCHEDYDSAKEYLENYYADDEGLLYLTDEEYDRYIIEKLEESEHYKAIVVYIQEP